MKFLIHRESAVHALMHYPDDPSKEYGQGAWNELLTSGTKYSSFRNPKNGKARKESFSAGDIRGIAASFDKVLSWGPVPVDANHATLFGALDAETTKALGHIMRVEVRDRDDGELSLWGFIEWTAEGSRRVQAGEFRGFSIEVVPAGSAIDKDTGEPMGVPIMTGGTVCNNPFWPGLAPLAATESAPLPTDYLANMRLTAAGEVFTLSETRPPEGNRSNTMKHIALKSIISALALSDDTSEADAVAALADVKRLADRTEQAERKLALTEAQRDEAQAQRDEAKAALSAIETDYKALSSERVEALFTRCCSEGRLTPAKRPAYDRIMRLTADQPWTERVEVVEETWAAGAVPELGESGHDSGGDGGLDGEDIDVEEQMVEYAEKLEAASGLSAREAWQQASEKFAAKVGKRWGGVGYQLEE